LVITAVITINTLAMPLGFLVSGQVLERFGVAPLFLATVVGVTTMAIVYSGIALRYRDVDATLAQPPQAEPATAGA
jgi:MFS family permease